MSSFLYFIASDLQPIRKNCCILRVKAVFVGLQETFGSHLCHWIFRIPLYVFNIIVLMKFTFNNFSEVYTSKTFQLSANNLKQKQPFNQQTNDRNIFLKVSKLSVLKKEVEF